MNLPVGIIAITILVLDPIISTNVCMNQQCKCSEFSTIVHCDTKDWTNLTDIEFPSKVVILTLNNNKLKFDTADDRSKIENLSALSELSLNLNPLGLIPAFNNSNIRSLSLQDTSLISAQFPSTYMHSFLRTISLSNNKIRTINADDFAALKYSPIKGLYIDSVSLSKIDQNAFNSLNQLQALSLKNNHLSSSEFLSTFPLLSSIQLDGNNFTSLPQELSTPHDIKTFSFTFNSITTIDESSPLHTWMKMNYTNLKIYLANNPFDCCQSLWFIRFLNTSSHFIGDASLLTCSTPSNYSGKQLIKLNPDEMNCGGIIPNKSWWTIERIIGVTAGGLGIVLLIIFIIFMIFIRQRRTRSGYTEIDGVDDPSPTAPIYSSSEIQFPVHGEDDDAISAYSTAVTGNTNGSTAPTFSTTGDDNQI